MRKQTMGVRLASSQIKIILKEGFLVLKKNKETPL